MSLSLQSFSKVNIGLKITGRLESGYHTLHTIFQEIQFGDTLEIKKTESGCTLSSDKNWVPTDSSNICYKAYIALKNDFPTLGGVSIHIKKSVPAGSGLGGGSANGAATLKGINTLYHLNLSENEMETAGISIGADVPFFIRGGTQLGEGIGSDLTPLPFSIKGVYLLVIPQISINTAWAYKQIKNELGSAVQFPNFAGYFNGEFSSFEFFENDFERIVIPAYPEIGTLKETLLKLGAKFASLSGSGSAVFGIFDEDASARKAESVIRPTHKTILTHPTHP